MTVISRSLVDHPVLGSAGGSSLHTSMNNMYLAFGNNAPGRYDEQTSIADSTTIEVNHNLGARLDELTVLIYTGTGATKSIVLNPVAAGWVIGEKTSFEKTIVEVTTPSSGGPHSFSVVILDALPKPHENHQVLATAPANPVASGLLKQWFSANGVSLMLNSSGARFPVQNMPVEIKNASFNAVEGIRYLVDTSGGAVTATLPASVTDQAYFAFEDKDKTFNTFNLTIARNGNNIDGTAADLVINTAGEGVYLTGDSASTNWVRCSTGAGGATTTGASGTNYYDNGLFESNLDGASVAAGVGTITAETADPIQGTQSALLTQGVGAAMEARFAINNIDNYVIDESLLILSEAYIRTDASDPDTTTFGIYNVTDAVYVTPISTLIGGGVLNIVSNLLTTPLLDSKTYVGRIVRADNTTGRTIVVDKLKFTPDNGVALIPQGDETTVPTFEAYATNSGTGGFGSSATTRRWFDTEHVNNPLGAFTVTNNSTDGTLLTIVTPGIYAVNWHDLCSTASSAGILKNPTPTESAPSATIDVLRVSGALPGDGLKHFISGLVLLAAGDTLACHTATPSPANFAGTGFNNTRVKIHLIKALA